MANTYTSLYQVFTDVNLYMAIQLNQTLTLDLFPTIIKNRFVWFADNWETLYQTFKTACDGDEILEENLRDFDNCISLYKTSGFKTSLTRYKLLDFNYFFNLINVNDMNLSQSEQLEVQREIGRIRLFTLETFRTIQAYVKEQINIMSNLNGGSDSDGNTILGYPSTTTSTSVSSWDAFGQVDRLIKYLDFIESIIFELRQQELKPPDLLSIASVNPDIDNYGVNINTAYLSSVSVPFEQSLENMARKYLGDFRKWYELVTINNLQEPYVDETGVKFTLTIPGSPATITFTPNSDTELYIGQKIRIGSAKYQEESRLILKKNVNNDGTVSLTLSGTKDLDKFLVQDRSYVRIFKPHTVNTGSYILIPINLRSPIPDALTPTREELLQLDKVLLNFGVDIKRDEFTGEYLIDQYGNFQLCYGLDAVRQTIKYLLKTAVGELPMHPFWGFNAGLGQRWMGTTSEGAVIAETIKTTILQDSRFNDVIIDGVSSTGNSVSISLTVYLTGSDVLIPLAFVV